jgi:hypothetical protein
MTYLDALHDHSDGGFRHPRWPDGVYMRIRDGRFEWKSKHRAMKDQWQAAPTCVAEPYGLLAPALQLDDGWEVA